MTTINRDHTNPKANTHTDGATDRTSAVRTRVRRASVVAVAAAVALGIWLVAVALAGVELVARQGGTEQSVGAASVVAVAVGAGVAGWLLLALLERLTPTSAPRAWRITTLAVLVLSIAGPLGAGVDGVTRGVLTLLHVAVGAVLIAALPQRAAAAERPPEAARR